MDDNASDPLHEGGSTLMYVINDNQTGKRAYIGCWLRQDLAEAKVALLSRTYPHMAERYEVLKIQ